MNQYLPKDIWAMGHHGDTQGMGGNLWYFPDKGVTLALFTNTDTERGEGGIIFEDLWNDSWKIGVASSTRPDRLS